MYQFQNILVGLDNSDLDEQLIKAAAYICEQSGSKDIYFINIIKDFDTPAELKKQFPNFLENALQEREAAIKNRVSQFFDTPSVNTHVVIKVGHILKDFLSYADTKNIDLILVGRKSDGGILNTRLARRASCSLLIMPADVELKMNKILVPIDFSDHARMALEKAASIAQKTKATIITQNVYQVPAGYHYAGKTFEQFAQVMRENAEKDFKKFSKNIDLNDAKLEQVYTLDKDEDVMVEVYKMAEKEKPDAIIIGAKGRTAATALFIGSKAEKIIQINKEFPLVIVRPKGKNAGIIDYLKEL